MLMTNCSRDAVPIRLCRLIRWALKSTDPAWALASGPSHSECGCHLNLFPACQSSMES